MAPSISDALCELLLLEVDRVTGDALFAARDALDAVRGRDMRAHLAHLVGMLEDLDESDALVAAVEAAPTLDDARAAAVSALRTALHALDAAGRLPGARRSAERAAPHGSSASRLAAVATVTAR